MSALQNRMIMRPENGTAVLYPLHFLHPKWRHRGSMNVNLLEIGHIEQQTVYALGKIKSNVCCLR